MNINKGEIQFLIKPLMILSSLALLLVILLTVGIGQVKSVIQKNDESTKNAAVLSQKVSVLKSVTEVIAGDTTFLDIVIPSKGAVLYGLSQVKNQAAKYGLMLSNIKTGAQTQEKGGINKFAISFEAEGQDLAVYDFLKSFSNILPLVTIDKVKISKSAAIARATVTLSVYSGELPKTIPSVSTSATQLTAEEIKLLKELVTYTLPIFIEPKAQESSTKLDPFNWRGQCYLLTNWIY